MAVAGVGFLSIVSEKVREFSDEPGASSKFSDNRILDMMRRAWSDVLDDINRVSSAKIRARINITIVAGQREYQLPPNIGQFLEFKKLNSEGYMEWEVLPNHPLAPSGPQFNIEGPMLYLDPKWTTGHTMRIDYVPTAESEAFEATETHRVTGSDAITTTDSATVGFAGATDLSLVTANYSIRLNGRTDGLNSSDIFDITAVDDSADTVTVSPVPDSDTSGVTYEIFMNTTHFRAAAAVAGTRDTLDNAYVGYIVRLLSTTEGTRQERVITAYSNTSGEFTVAPAFNPSPGKRTTSNLLTFEVVPQQSYRYQDLIALKVARFIASITGDRKRVETLQVEYRDSIRALRLREAQKEARIGMRFHRTTRGRGRWGKTV